MPNPDGDRRRADRVAGILLAAGVSRRMGRNKMLMELDGESVLRRAARHARGAGLDPVVVVLGHERQRAEAELEGLDCQPVFNPDYETGIHTSVRAGVQRLPDDVTAGIVILADMPFVTSEMLGELVRHYREGEAPLVISRYGGEVNAPPMLYDRRLFPELEVMERRCGREVVQRHRDEAEEVDWPGRALKDVDHPEDYEQVRHELEE